MKIRKKLFNRIAGSKRSTPPGPGEEGNDIPPPSAIERISPDSALGSEESGYGADFELLASGEQTRSDSSSGMDMQENGYGADLELLAAAGADEPPNESGPPREPAQPAGYGPGFELLAGSGADELPDELEPAQEHGEAATDVAESAVEASASGPEITQESEPEITGDIALKYEEPLAAAVSDESPDEAEPSREQEVSSSIEVAADPPPEQAEEPSETPLTENGFYPLVRNARGAWRPGKGFSRSELQEAGLSLSEAARLRIRFDKRRRNAHPMNVATLEEAKNGV